MHYALYSDNQVLLWSALVPIHNAMQGIYATFKIIFAYYYTVLI